MNENEPHAAAWAGLEVFGSDGERVGTVEAVRHEDGPEEPRWLVVGGLAGGSRKLVIPAAEVRQAGDRLTLPYAAERIMSAPELGDAGLPTEEEKGRLCRYYGLVYGVGQEERGDGCEEMPDNRPAG